jgi:hypothetical protein
MRCSCLSTQVMVATLLPALVKIERKAVLLKAKQLQKKPLGYGIEKSDQNNRKFRIPDFFPEKCKFFPMNATNLSLDMREMHQQWCWIPAQPISIPPLTFRTCPVIYPASSEARNFTAWATSMSDPACPKGIISFTLDLSSAESVSVMAVSM